jgi:N-acetylglucosaminyl-diphospho-decaprenol L-rhamnosyltransferase
MKTVDIVIVNWNTGELLGECLRSMLVCRLPQDFALGKVVVVDNASHDDSLSGIDAIPLPLKLIRNTANRGFAAACNQGAAAGSGDVILLLNPDTRLFEHSLAAPLERLLSPRGEKIGVVGVQLLDEQGAVARTCARLPRPGHFFHQAIGTSRVWPVLGQTMLEWDHASSREVGQVIGAFFMTPRALYDSLGGLDEQFFVYFEEVDYSARALAAGWKSLYLVEAQAFHLGGGSSRKVLDRRLMYSIRSRLIYARKHFSMLGRWSTWLSSLTLEPPIRMLHAAATGGLPNAAAVYRGYKLLISDWLSRGGNQP